MTTDSAPYVFLLYQQKWAGDESAVKVIEKSRRIGLSWSEAGDDTLYAASEEGDDVWYIGYNKEMAEEFINDCAWWARQYSDVVGEIGAVEEEVITDAGKDILTFRIRFASGNKIVALSSRPSNLRGKQGRVVIDEAAFHDDLKELIKAAIALLIWGGQVRIISTHDGDGNYFNELVNDIRAGRLPYSLHRVTLDDALDQGFYKRICLKLKREWTQAAQDKWRQDLKDSYGDGADEELFCVPSQGSGSAFSRVLVENCMSPEIPVIRYGKPDEFKYLDEKIRKSEVEAWCEDTLLDLLEKLDPHRQSFFGEDFGRTGDLTVLTPLQETQAATFRAPFVLELRNMPFKQQEQIVFYIIDNLPRFSHGSFDARGNGQYLAEVAAQKYGQSRITEVMLSEKWYRENMPKYKNAFEDKSILLPLDADIIEDHRAFKVVKGVIRLPEGKTNAKSKEQRHGDSGVSGAMAWHATGQEGGGVTEYKSTAKRRFAGRGAW
jgi:phage FluMu gp28-like protein